MVLGRLRRWGEQIKPTINDKHVGPTVLASSRVNRSIRLHNIHLGQQIYTQSAISSTSSVCRSSQKTGLIDSFARTTPSDRDWPIKHAAPLGPKSKSNVVRAWPLKRAICVGPAFKLLCGPRSPVTDPRHCTFEVCAKRKCSIQWQVLACKKL